MKADRSGIAPKAEEAVALLKAFAHPSRLIVCCALREREMSVGDMEAALNIKQPNLSRELAKLRTEGIVETRRNSKVIFYRLSGDTRVANFVDAICAVMTDAWPSAANVASVKRDTVPTTRWPRRSSHFDQASGYGVFAKVIPTSGEEDRS
ncbi:MAG: metalloregulator ArsR/SmtB family transcription factor [Alphaproteobacteria bacterium]|nr:metalloregulator ArsR/SmtB family transcription factor [Alphaproteobacteria bacterium]